MKRQKTILSLVSLLLILLGCGVNDETSEENSATQTTEQSSTSPTTTETLFGSVILGPVQNALVKAYKLNNDGTRGEELASGESDENGEYSLSLSYSGAIELVATGGRYIDEATGEEIQREEQEQIRTMLMERSKEHVGINALTEMAAEQTKQQAANGLENAIRSANANIANMFGITDIDFVKTKPHDLTNPDQVVDEESSESRLGLVMAAFSQMAKDNGLEPEELGKLIRNMAQDCSDGEMDGAKNGETLSEDLEITPQQAMNSLGNAYQNFAEGPQNQSGYSAEEIPSGFGKK